MHNLRYVRNYIRFVWYVEMGLLSLPEDCSKDQKIEIYVKLRVWDRESGNEAKGFKVTAE